MFLLLALLWLVPAYSVDEELDFYIQRFRYQELKVTKKSDALFSLGRKIFNDKNLSGKRNISCNDCHSKKGFSGDSLPLGIGEGATGLGKDRYQSTGLVLARHTQNIFNVGFPEFKNHFWDGRVEKSFEGYWRSPEPKFNGPEPELKLVAKTFQDVTALQAIFPFTSPEEMLGKESKLSRLEAWDQVLERLFEGTDKEYYLVLFSKAFPGTDKFNIAHVGNALSHFMRIEFSAVNTPWDIYLKGNKKILTTRMKRGAILFHSKAGCFRCHNGNHFTNFTFHNIGIPQIGADDQGRKLISNDDRDLYAFRVPALRNVGVTAPYMHSGALKDLKQVINHYNDPVSSLRFFQWNSRIRNYRDSLNLDTDSVRNDNRERTLSPMLARSLDLTNEEKEDLVCFLGGALTDMSYQKEIIRNGVLDEITDCSLRSP